MIDGPPIRQPRLERRLDLPVLDEILDHLRQTPRNMVHAFACSQYQTLAKVPTTPTTRRQVSLASPLLFRLCWGASHLTAMRSHRPVPALRERSLVGATRDSC